VLYVQANAFDLSLGAPKPSSTAYTISGYAYGDTSAVVNGSPELTCNYNPTVSAGIYPILVSSGSLSAANYTFVFMNSNVTAGYTNLQAQLEVESISAKEWGDENFTLTTTGGSGSGTVSFEVVTNNDGAIALNPVTGMVTITGTGNADVRAIKQGAFDGSYRSAVSGNVTIAVSPRDLSNAVIALPGSFTFNEAAQTPVPTVTDMVRGVNILSSPRDYTCSWSNNISTTPGPAAVTISVTGNGNYFGANRTVNFTIQKANPTIVQWPADFEVIYDGGTHVLSEYPTGPPYLTGIAVGAGGVSVPGFFSWAQGANINVSTASGVDTPNYNGTAGDLGPKVHNVRFIPQGNNYEMVESTLTIYVRLVDTAPIAAGTFMMGRNNDPQGGWQQGDEQPMHQVTLTQGFSMGKYEVLQPAYQLIMGNNPSAVQAVYPGSGEDPAKLPVTNMSWYDAVVFCNKLSAAEGLSPAYEMGVQGSWTTDPDKWALAGSRPVNNSTATVLRDSPWNNIRIVAGSNGYRLPTEAQWEYACRAGVPGWYHDGNADPLIVNNGRPTTSTFIDGLAWWAGNSGDPGNYDPAANGHQIRQAGQKTPNAWGLYDMHGNVWEMCWDWFAADYYSKGPGGNPVLNVVSGNWDDPMGPAKPTSGTTYYVKSWRGGAHSTVDYRDLRIVNRAGTTGLNGDTPWMTSGNLGFRVIRPR
jgi:formylglycine-generating enzyme required for sulfatase activity